MQSLTSQAPEFITYFLAVILILQGVADIWTTERALAQGGIEANPIMAAFWPPPIAAAETAKFAELDAVYEQVKTNFGL